MQKTDKIAILLASYNGERFIEEQIESLLSQTKQQWELFIHDDGSRDHTRDIVQDYAQRYPANIHVLDGPPCGGAKDNFLYLLRNVQAPYIMFCDQDDVWLPKKITLTMERMLELEAQMSEEKPILVFSDLCVVDEELRTIAERMSVYQRLDPKRTRLKDLMIQNVISGSSIMINRALAELAVKPEMTDNIIMHDWWCALIAACFGGISYVDQSLVLYRQHGSNSVGAKNLNSLCYFIARFRNKKNIKDSLFATQRQAALFAEIYPAADPILREYGALSSKSKMKRLRFYAMNDIRKNGWQRNLGLLIWG